DRKKTYHLEPLSLLGHAGVTYLLALDTDAERREKLFRLDRIGTLATTGQHFSAPAELDLERFRTPKLYFGHDELWATVRFAAAIGARVRERFAGESLTEAPDGSLSLRLGSSSPAFLARWILPFALDAEITAPPAARSYLAELCSEAARAYSDSR
ncbi:MAG: WYL domain-containing protein, partial [Myxococcota bacterium]